MIVNKRKDRYTSSSQDVDDQGRKAKRTGTQLRA